ncbi:MAG: hypothetical protein R6X02_02075 [Enhygromyxa sp.]
MRSRSWTTFGLGLVGFVLAAPGCGKPAEQATTSEASTKQDQAQPVAVDTAAPPELEPPPEVDTAAPPEPEPPPEAEPEPPGLRAGEGFEIGPKLEAREGESEVELADPLRFDGATVSVAADEVAPDDDEDDEGQYQLSIQVRIEVADGGDPKLGLNHAREVSTTPCDEVVAELQEIATLPGGRRVIDAQLACRNGEDYFSAENAHTLILVEPGAKTASVLWTGVDKGSNAMGVCVSSILSSFELVGDELIVRRTESTELDKQAAKELPEPAEGCKPKPETTEVVERIRLASSE